MCVCPGAQGAQTCAPDGRSWLPCSCSASASGSSGGAVQGADSAAARHEGSGSAVAPKQTVRTELPADVGALDAQRVTFVGPFASQRDAYLRAVAKHSECLGTDAGDSLVPPDDAKYGEAMRRLQAAEAGEGLQVLAVLCDPGRGLEVAYLPTFVDDERRVWAWPTIQQPFWYTRQSLQYEVGKPAYNSSHAFWQLPWSEIQVQVPYDDCAAVNGGCEATTTTTRQIIFAVHRGGPPKALVATVASNKEGKDVKSGQKSTAKVSRKVEAEQAGVRIDGQLVAW